MATHSSILAWKIPRTEEGAWQATVHRVTKESGMTLATKQHSTCILILQIFVPFLNWSVVDFGLPRWHSNKESTCQCRRGKRLGFDSRVKQIPWNRKWQLVPILLLGKFHGQRILAGYSPWGHELDMTEHTSTHVVDLQCSASFMYIAQWFITYMFFFRFFSIIGYCKILSIVLCAIQ